VATADGDYSDVKLEFMRSLVVWGAGDVPEACVCMDTLGDVAGPSCPVSEHDLVRCRASLVAAEAAGVSAEFRERPASIVVAAIEKERDFLHASFICVPKHHYDSHSSPPPSPHPTSLLLSRFTFKKTLRCRESTTNEGAARDSETLTSVTGFPS
jgi:hypothetical protein